MVFWMDSTTSRAVPRSGQAGARDHPRSAATPGPPAGSRGPEALRRCVERPRPAIAAGRNAGPPGAAVVGRDQRPEAAGRAQPARSRTAVCLRGPAGTPALRSSSRVRRTEGEPRAARLGPERSGGREAEGRTPEEADPERLAPKARGAQGYPQIHPRSKHAESEPASFLSSRRTRTTGVSRWCPKVHDAPTQGSEGGAIPTGFTRHAS